MNSLPALTECVVPRWFDRDPNDNDTRLQKLSRNVASGFLKHVAAKLPRGTDCSDASLNVLIPATLDTVETVLLCVQGIRRHLMHPVEKIAVVGPAHPKIKDVCDQAGVCQIDELLLLPQHVRDRIGDIGNGDPRKLIGEFTKLAACDYMACDELFVCEADTILIRDQTFIADSAQILYVADDPISRRHHAVNKRLLGDITPHKRSFVTRNALFERTYIHQMRRLIEVRAHTDWFSAILSQLNESEQSGFSAYELYGTFLWNFYPDKIETRYWYNQKCRSNGLGGLRDLSQNYRGFNSISAALRS
jgi:hypothetical protein